MALRPATPADSSALPQLGLAGTDLNPLPYESYLSCLLRLAWRNVFSRAQLWSAIGVRSSQLYFYCDEFFERLGWPRPSRRERTFMIEFAQDRDIWYVKLFRYCPLCLAHGYHSYLFQWRSLARCPVHDVALTTSCQFCGCGLGKYDLTFELCHRPYFCMNCRRAISGVPPSLDLHLDLRAVPGVLSSYFDQYGAWWEQTASYRAAAGSIGGLAPGAKQSQWCDVGRLLRSVAAQGRGAPARVDLETYPSAALIVLEWRCQARVRRPWFGNRETSRGWPRRPVYEAVYRCTLRMLAKWIATENPWDMSRAGEQTSSLGTPNAGNCDAKLSALYYLRLELECNFDRSTVCLMPALSKAYLYRQPVVDMAEFEQRTCRLAWRAIFLALYASWYHRIASGKVPLFEKLAGTISNINNHIFSVVELRSRLGDKWHVGEVFLPDEVWFCGRVAFLRVPGMPHSFFSNKRSNAKWHTQQLADETLC